MDALSTFLDKVKKGGLARSNLLGLLNVLIGRSISDKDGTVLSRGLTWRAVAGQLKRLRWDPDQVSELGLDSSTLAPRDRQRYWYAAISRAHVNSPEAAAAGDKLATVLRKHGYDVGGGPS